MSLLERLFHLRDSGTTATRELVAGLVTFSALSYILFVQPAILSHPASPLVHVFSLLFLLRYAYLLRFQ